MNSIDKLKKTIILLKEAGEYELVSDLLCAFAALTDSEMPRVDLTYSSLMRDLRMNNKDKVNNFQKLFKKYFNDAIDDSLDNPEQIALMQAIKELNIEV